MTRPDGTKTQIKDLKLGDHVLVRLQDGSLGFQPLEYMTSTNDNSECGEHYHTVIAEAGFQITLTPK